ncbi:uncharacterized protein LOC124884214 isoform X2 [Girardinichthys multiradiatus]|uniref:uncharacterized protein LOC124884214 isoform X2 n=1 Tax=Girardinichthys multiradiatus TaxID=208333 RepID=UPI001FAB70F8|nr:uncharacterized protein LOC124884214 isoform X2 [Girardinichthys multiradiatus]
MSDEAVPHISLSLHPEHQAKELGGVVKHSLAAGDWQDTPVTNISSETTQAQQNLGGTNITYTHEGINMADGITQEEPHQCEELVSRTEKLQTVVEPYNKVLGSERSTGEPTTPQVEWVWLKVIKQKWAEPRFTGPYQVTERTSHAVRLKGKGDTWFHWSQCAEAPEPGRPLEEIGENTASSQGAE